MKLSLPRGIQLAHELLHQANRRGVDQRDCQELEAEAVAYVVCRYIALWGGDAKALAASFSRISTGARALIDGVEQAAASDRGRLVTASGSMTRRALNRAPPLVTQLSS